VDPARQNLQAIVGFMVNLDWVRQHYFQELVARVVRIQGGNDASVGLAVVDAHSVPVVGTLSANVSNAPSSSRTFSLLFFDPVLVALKLRGLKMGADDYVTKPFDLEELIARVHAVLRRARPTIDRLNLGSVTIDFVGLEAWNEQGPIDLTYREFSVLRYLAERADSIVHRDELLHEIWGYPESPNTRAVDHAVARLRRTIEADLHHPRFIQTVHGDGDSLTISRPQLRPIHGQDYVD
jgi:CheY-like chemotaxis protein